MNDTENMNVFAKLEDKGKVNLFSKFYRIGAFHPGIGMRKKKIVLNRIEER